MIPISGALCNSGFAGPARAAVALPAIFRYNTRMAENKEMKFEEALAQLEKLVAEMESGRLPLDTMVGRFEEGRRLVDFCSRELESIQRRIDQVTAEGVKPLEA